MYINCHSYYSLRYGTLSPKELVGLAHDHGLKSLALTDINTTTGIPEFVKECYKFNIKPIAGIEFRTDCNTLLYIGLAQNKEGFKELNDFLTWHNLNKAPLPPCPPVFNWVYVIYPFGKSLPRRLKPNEYIGIKPDELKRLPISPLRHLKHKLVAMQPVTFASPQNYELHLYLRAISLNTLISKVPPVQLARKEEHILPLDFLAISYEDYPDLLINTRQLVEQCGLFWDFEKPKNKQLFSSNRNDDKRLLRKLALDGMKYRYGSYNMQARLRIEHELKVIDKLGFSAYFLITWDIIRYSMNKGLYHVGRGSGANSIVAYCLRITNVDPIALNLYFERFINPKRSSPPDFDIDYSWTEREDVQDYIFKRYGQEHTALMGTVTTFKDRSIFRELGKTLGLPKHEIDYLVHCPNEAIEQNEINAELSRIGLQLLDLPNIRSVHSGGIIISEEPLTYYTALDLPPKGFPTTQWDMYTAEVLRFEKLDILSQRGIGHINECKQLVLKNKKTEIDVHQVQNFIADEKINKKLQEGNTTGCFYIESPAMRGLLKKLRCRGYRSLVAASSIIRPGVAKSGMMKEYIRRFHEPQKTTYLHPVMEEQLKETLGVMVYQEDVIKICHHFAGLDLSDADILRRAMAGKYRSKKEFERIKLKFFTNCKSKGYPDKLATEVWRQISSFAGYAFSKAHSASYAVESYQSLYLKTYYPHEFIVAVINNFGGFYSSWVYFNEAAKLGASLHLPCVNKSLYKTNLSGSHIYIGFVHLQHLESELAHNILSERNLHGAFLDLEDFIKRTKIGKEQLLLLIRINAFRFTGKTKKELIWEAQVLLRSTKPQPEMAKLFGGQTKKYQLPSLEQNNTEDAYDEMELIGFPFSLNAFDLLITKFRGEIYARHLGQHVGKTIKILGNLVCIKNIKTIKHDWMHFGCFLDVEGAFFDTVNFPDSLKKFPFQGLGVYLILGKVVEEFGFPSIEVKKMAKLPIKPDPRYA